MINGALGGKNTTARNPNIFKYTPNGSDSAINTMASKAITNVNNLIAMALSQIQNAIINQALSDIRSVGGSQSDDTGSSVTLPQRLSDAMALNTPLLSIAKMFGFSGAINSSVVNQVYLSIAKGIRTTINTNFQQGMSEAISVAMNGYATVHDDATNTDTKKTDADFDNDFKSLKGYSDNVLGKIGKDINPEGLASNGQAYSDIIRFVQAVGYAYGKKLAPSILAMAAKNAMTDNGSTDAITIINNLHDQGVINDKEYAQLTTVTTGKDSNGNTITSFYDDGDAMKNYQANPLGAQNTILAIYNAEVNAIKQAISDFNANPNITIDSNKIQFVNQGTAGNNVYDTDTKTMSVSTATSVAVGDYANVLAYLQSSNAAKKKDKLMPIQLLIARKMARWPIPRRLTVILRLRVTRLFWERTS